MGRLQGKVALITGAARGTGEATARLFVEEGARVALADILDEQAQGVAKDLGDAALSLHLDVRSADDWSDAVAKVESHFGALHVLVNNAAVLHLGSIADTEPEDFQRLVAVNQIGPFLGMRAVTEPMRRAGAGAIVNISSVDGLRGQNGVIAYASTKWALRGMTKVAAVELGKFGIRVNAVCPEAGSPEMIAPYMPEGFDLERATSRGMRFLPAQRDRTMRERLRDVAQMVAFLASDDAATCTGGDFPVEAGNSSCTRTPGAPGA